MTATRPVVGGQNDLSFDLDYQNRDVPDSQKLFLEKLGWTHAGYHPDTQEEMFHKQCPSDATDTLRNQWDWQLASGYWHWYEAVAYEFSKFIGIGDDKGKSQGGSGSATMGSAPAGV